MFKIGQSVRYTTRGIGIHDRTHYSMITKITARKITLKDGTGWTLDGREWGVGRPRAGWPYTGAQLIVIGS